MSMLEEEGSYDVYLQIVDREQPSSSSTEDDASFLSGWEARQLPLATVTADNPCRDEGQKPSRIRLRGSDCVSKVKDIVGILLGDDLREKQLVLGSTPVQHSLTWVCYLGPALGANSSNTSGKANGGDKQDVACSNDIGGSSTSTTTAPASLAPDSERGKITATTTTTGTTELEKVEKQESNGISEQHAASRERVRLLDASGKGFSVNVGNGVAYPLTIPLSMAIADAEKMLRQVAFEGKELRLLPLELDSELPESEEEGSRSAGQQVDACAGKAESGNLEERRAAAEAEADEKRNEARSEEGSGHDDAEAVESNKGAPRDLPRLVSSLIAVDQITGERRLEVTLAFPHVESDSEIEEDPMRGYGNGGTMFIGGNDSCSESDAGSYHSEEDVSEEEEGAPHTAKSVASSLERALAGEGRPVVGEWVIDLPAPPVAHLLTSGAEFALIGKANVQAEGHQGPSASLADGEGIKLKEHQHVDEIAREQRARLGPLLDKMKRVDRCAVLNGLGDSVLRPGLFTITSTEIEEAGHAEHFSGYQRDYEETAAGRRMCFSKSLSGAEISITVGEKDIESFLIEAGLPGKIRTQLDTGFPVGLQFVRLDAGGCCDYMDKLRAEKAEHRRKEIEEARKIQEKRKKAAEQPGAQKRRRRVMQRGSFFSSSENSSSDEQVDQAGPRTCCNASGQVAPPVAAAAVDSAIASQFEGEHAAGDPEQVGAETTGQSSSSSSSSSRGSASASLGAAEAPAVCNEEFKSDDEDAAYDRFAKDVLKRDQATAPKLSPVVAEYRRPFGQPKHAKHPGRRRRNDAHLLGGRRENVFQPRVGRWSALLSEDDADVLRRRDDERCRTIGTLLVSVQGPWTESAVATHVRCGEMRTRIILVPKGGGAAPVAGGEDRGHKTKCQIRCSAIIRGVDVTEPTGLGIGKRRTVGNYGTAFPEMDETNFDRGHAFVLVYRITRSRRVPIIDRQLCLEHVLPDLLRSDSFPEKPGEEPPNGNDAWDHLAMKYEDAIKKAVRKEELDRLAAQGFWDTKAIRREETIKFRNRRWKLGSAESDRDREHVSLSSSGEICALARRMGSILRRAWASKVFMPSGGTLVLPNYEAYGPRDLHPLRSQSLSKPLQRVLPDSSAARALCLAAQSGIAEQTGSPKAVRAAHATAASSGATFYPYKDADTLFEQRLCLVGDDGDSYNGVRGYDLTFQDQLPPFRFRSRHPQEADAFGDGVAAAALVCGGPVTFAKGETVVRTEDHSMATEISEEAGPWHDPESDHIVRELEKFSCSLIELSGGTKAEEASGAVKTLTAQDAMVDKIGEEREEYWLEYPSSEQHQRSLQPLTAVKCHSTLSTESEFWSAEPRSGRCGPVRQGGGPMKDPRVRVSITLGLAGALKLVVPPYEKRGFLPVTFPSEDSRTVAHEILDDLRARVGRNVTKKELQAELGPLRRFWPNFNEKISASDPIVYHRCPMTVRCETLDLLSWFWMRAHGFRRPRDRPAKDDDAGASENEVPGISTLDGSELRTLICGNPRDLHSKIVPKFLAGTCPTSLRRMEAGSNVSAKAFSWTLVFPSRGIHPGGYGGSANYADHMCAYRDLLQRAASPTLSTQDECQPLELLVPRRPYFQHFKEQQIWDSLKAIAPAPDLELIDAAHYGGGEVRLRWYLQELSSHPQNEKSAPDTDAAKTIGAVTKVESYVLDAAPVSNPFEGGANRSAPIRELAIKHGTQAFRPRRALAVHKLLPSKHLQPAPKHLGNALQQSTNTSSSCNDAQTTTSADQQKQEHQLPAAGDSDSQLEFVPGGKTKESFSTKEALRSFLLEEIGPQYDCINTEEIWVAPLPSKLEWPSVSDLKGRYHKPRNWAGNGLGQTAEKPSKEDRAKHREDWEKRNDARARRKVRRAKRNLIYFPLAKQELAESAADSSDGNANAATACSSNASASKTSCSRSCPVSDATSGKKGDNISYRGFYLCAAFHITFPPSPTRWQPSCSVVPSNPTCKKTGGESINGSCTSSAAASGKRTAEVARGNTGESAYLEEVGAPRKRTRTDE